MTHLDEPGLLVELAAREYLAARGVPLVPATLARDRRELDAAVWTHGRDLVLKVAAPWLLHKSDLDLVRVGIAADEAPACFDELVALATPHGPIDGVLVSPRVPGVEMIVGVRRDPALGAFVLVGAGGTLVEVLDDVAVAPVPITPGAAAGMIGDLRASALMGGGRGARVLDVEALARLVASISELAAADARLVELDLNPVIVGERRAVAVDARAVVRPEPSGPPLRRHRDLRPLFDPGSIAVIGASTDPNKLGARVVRYLVERGFPGRVVPIHRTASEIHGCRAVASIADAGAVDLASIVVPRDAVASALEGCAAAGIRTAIVHTSGFAEAGGDGPAAQAQLVATAERAGIDVCGPNSLGVISPGRRTFASFAGALESSSILAGRIGFVSQSGAIASSLLSRSVDDGVGFSRWVSSGNEADLDLADFVAFLATDPETDVIALFVEQIRDGDAFREAVRTALEAGKPVLAFKSGRSVVGRRITRSHTGALAGDDRLYSAFLRDAGVVRIASLRDLLDAARVIAVSPRAGGRRLGAVTMSGGASSVIADVAAELGLVLPAPEGVTAEVLAGLLPAAATVGNPLDVTAAAMVEPGILTSVVERMMEAPFIDVVLVQLTTNADPVAAEMAAALVELHRSARKPLIVSRLGSPSLAPRAMELYRSASVPVLTWPEDATRVAWALAVVGETMMGVSAQQEVALRPDGFSPHR